MSWKDQLRGDPLPWLLEEVDPGPRYLALRDLMDCSPDAGEMIEARRLAHTQGAIVAILSQMAPEGYWAEPGPGYRPKYTSTVWSVIMLAQLGASMESDPRIERACSYVLDHALREGGYFTMTGAPSGTVDCLQGSLCWALTELGCEDRRLDEAFEWMARSVTGAGVAAAGDAQAGRRYYAGNCGPTFACGGNNKLPCAWGAVKVMLALGRLPPERRTSLIDAAITRGVEFLFSADPAQADYPAGWSDKPSRNWWKFGFPVFYVTDLLQNAEALVALGYGRDPRLAKALALIRDKQDPQGRWMLEYDYAGKTWVDFGKKKQPNKWVTLRALRVLKAALQSV
jgi:hypothetical protein